MREEAVISACFIAARDGENDLIDKHGAWMRGTFASAFAKEQDAVHGRGLAFEYNSPAIAFAQGRRFSSGTGLISRTCGPSSKLRPTMRALLKGCQR